MFFKSNINLYIDHLPIKIGILIIKLIVTINNTINWLVILNILKFMLNLYKIDVFVMIKMLILLVILINVNVFMDLK